MERKKFRPLTACTTNTGKRKGKTEDSSLEGSVVARASKEKRMMGLVACSKGKNVVEEEVSAPPDDKTKYEEWVHTIWSDNSDDERNLSDIERSFENFFTREDISDDEEYLRRFPDEVVRRAFSVSTEKGAKLLNQKQKIWRLNVMLNKRSDITHDSCEEYVFQKLDNEGYINNIPKDTALAYINGAISRKECLYQYDLKYEIVKKLVTVVPIIKIGKDYSISQVANFARIMGFPNITSSSMIEYPLFYIEDTLSRIMEEKTHPVVYMERIKEILSVIENDAKRNRRERIQCWKDCPSLHFVDEIKVEEDEIKSSEDYQSALKVVQLHQEFHRHLASSLYIKHDMKIKDLIKDDRVVERRFQGLDKTLIKASLKARINLLKKFNELDVYYEWLIELVERKIKEGRSRMDEILEIIRVEHPGFPTLPKKWFFRRVKDIPHGWTDKEKEEESSLFYGLLDKVKKHTRCPLSYAFVIEGIMDYVDASARIEDVKYPEEFEDPSSYIHSLFLSKRVIWLKSKVWDETFYEHPDYTTVYEDMSTLI